MSSQADPSRRRGTKLSFGTLAGTAAVIVLIGAMAFDTKVVVIGSDEDVQEVSFNPEQFGQEQFPLIRDSVSSRAVDAATLAEALASDQSAATAKYGVGEGFGPVLPVTFTGVVGEGKSGIFSVAVDGMPEGVGIRVQTGPAINGTELRDATGDIAFGQFTNQIEYQNAGAAINNAMKVAVLGDLDRSELTGKTITVTGAFKLINPKNWLVTPVGIDVQ